MKYKTFRGLLVAGAVAVVGGGAVWMLASKEDKPAPAPAPVVSSKPPEAPPSPPPVSPPPTVPTSTPAAGDALRPMDVDVLARARKGISGDKEKDAFPGKPYKVSLYKDAGFSSVNRVKIDLDRDGKWDEKWTFLGEAVKRQVSPADDDQTYSVEYMLAGDRWQAKGGGQAAPPPPPPPEQPAAPPEGSVALRPMDSEIIGRATQGIAGDKEKDAFPGKPYKVSLYKDAGQPRVNRAKVDLDRDEKWDEKWTFEGEEVKRQVAPDDDEVYKLEFRLRAGAWVPKK